MKTPGEMLPEETQEDSWKPAHLIGAKVTKVSRNSDSWHISQGQQKALCDTDESLCMLHASALCVFIIWNQIFILFISWLNKAICWE